VDDRVADIGFVIQGAAVGVALNHSPVAEFTILNDDILSPAPGGPVFAGAVIVPVLHKVVKITRLDGNAFLPAAFPAV
jgi:hypothetical protein